MPEIEHRESRCPVHFVWDGKGAGRWPVRLAFLGACAVGAAWTGTVLLRAVSLQPWVAWSLVPVGVLWCAGQVLSRVGARRAG